MSIPRHTKFLISSLFAGVGGVLLFSSPALAADNAYKVSKGDTLSGIGTEVGIPWQTLAQENNLANPNLIFPGQVLNLTGKVATTTTSLKSKTLNIKSVEISVASKRYGLDHRTAEVAREAAALLGPMFDLDHIGGFATSGHVTHSDHYTGHALDLGIGTIEHGHATGDKMAAYVVAHAGALDVKYVIWNHRIWQPGEGWHQYHGENPHTDHVHVSFKG